MVRFYLREEPLLGQVETFDLGEPETLDRALDVFGELVIKDRGSSTAGSSRATWTCDPSC